MLCSIIYRRLFFSLLQSSERSLKLEHITAAVVKELKSSCSECGPEMIDNQLFVCYPESPSFLTYRARLEGTSSETDSGSLVSLIEDWVRGDGANLIMTGVLMTVDSHCSVAISSLSQPQCPPSSTDMPAVERSSDEEPAQVSDAIIGGVVAVVIVLIIAITIAVITIIFLILRNRRGEVSPKNISDKKYDCDVCPSIKL
jgi:hypothetical protein